MNGHTVLDIYNKIIKWWNNIDKLKYEQYIEDYDTISTSYRFSFWSTKYGILIGVGSPFASSIPVFRTQGIKSTIHDGPNPCMCMPPRQAWPRSVTRGTHWEACLWASQSMHRRVHTLQMSTSISKRACILSNPKAQLGACAEKHVLRHHMHATEEHTSRSIHLRPQRAHT